MVHGVYLRGNKINKKHMEYRDSLAVEMSTGENTNHQDFEDFLKDCFMEEEPESVGNKDTFDDNFDNWLQNLDAEEWLEYGDKFNRVNR